MHNNDDGSARTADEVFRGKILINGVVSQASVGITGETISQVCEDPAGSIASKRETLLSDDEVLIPGVVDTHVHINEPGRTEWEGFDYATRAAAYGGITTVIDMPLNSNPPTLSVDALELKQSIAAGKAYTQLGFWGGVDGSNLGHLKPLWDAGVFGFKAFLSPSGVEEYGSLSFDQLEDAMREIADFGGQLIIHAEEPDELMTDPTKIGQSYRSFAESRPAKSESDAVEHVMKLVERTGCKTHILHVSSGLTVSVLADAKASGLPVTAETCPHYLTLDCDHIPDGNTAFKCCPPIRSLQEQNKLWEGLVDGTIDMVVTDHSPTTARMKAGTLASAWGGVSSLQVGFRAVLTSAMQRGLGLADVIRWMSTNSSAFVELHDRGSITVGNRADLVVLKPQEHFIVDAAKLSSRNPISAFDGKDLQGVVVRTLIGGAEPTASREHLILRK
ncbi:allantoinase [Bifidobacterium aquikefiri]|uniref:allantoinase n=1 Tax=Bifidobacterium aquikefiri TaxID=1653207 RepID=A0A261GB01_9BIFI|nr:allantoinase AllB [Bifidobacterium aquikefiri]OZG68423.1 allantoinase [Bifidobacterium aquikefiri]